MISQYKKILNIKAELLSKDSTFSGIIEKLTNKDLYIRTIRIESEPQLQPGETLEIKLKPPNGEALRLNCKVKWSYKTPPHGITESVGIEIMDPLSKYKEFLRTLQ